MRVRALLFLPLPLPLALALALALALPLPLRLCSRVSWAMVARTVWVVRRGATRWTREATRGRGGRVTRARARLRGGVGFLGGGRWDLKGKGGGGR